MSTQPMISAPCTHCNDAASAIEGCGNVDSSIHEQNPAHPRRCGGYSVPPAASQVHW